MWFFIYLCSFCVCKQTKSVKAYWSCYVDNFNRGFLLKPLETPLSTPLTCLDEPHDCYQAFYYTNGKALA